MTQRKQSRVLRLLLGFVLAFSMLASLPMQAYGAEVTITILHTNDVHGRFYQVDTSNTGMIGIDVIAAIDDATPNSILVDVGDAIHGLPIATINRGDNAIELMIAAGYDVMAPGNHDFNYGSARLSELATAAALLGMDIISANVYDTVADDYFLDTTTTVTVGGVKVGFFGLTTTTTPTVTNPVNVSTLQFREYKVSADAAIAALQSDGCDIIVCLAHVSRPEIEALLPTLAVKPDLVIDGHDHLSGSVIVDGVVIAGAGQYQENLGKVDIVYDDTAETIVSVTPSLITKAGSEIYTADPTVNALAEGMKAAVNAAYSEVFATSEIALSSDRGDASTPGVRNSEQPLGNLVADAMRIVGGADVAITNGGGLRADINVGDITKGDLFSVLPFGNWLVIKEVTPKALKAILEHGLQAAPEPDGRFPQVSGIEVVYDQSQPVGSKVISIKLGGVTLDLNDDSTKYKLATNDFMAAGGDGFTAIEVLTTLAELDMLEAVFIQYVSDNLGGTIPAAAYSSPEGRVTVYQAPAVNKTALNNAITAAEALVRNEYTSASWQPFAAALAAARLVAADPDATQVEVDAALAALQQARQGLVKPGSSTPATGDAAIPAAVVSATMLAFGVASLAAERRRRRQAA